MLDVILHITATPYFWASLGSITALAMFIGPILYNGDLTLLWKSFVSVGLYGLLIALIMQSHVIYIENLTFPNYLQPTIFVSFVTISYIIGLYLGVLIHKYIHKFK